MNARIASILKDRISQFTYVDRLAGMVRVGQMERAGQVLKLPIAIDADDDLACDDSTLRDMVPDERYACMVYFEDRGFQRITSRTRGTSYRSTLRLVCWVNTAKFSGDHLASERILQQFLGVVHAPSPVNTDTLVGLRTTAETGPERGGSLFSSYTYPESARPFLMWPFDAFAIDIAAEYRLRPGCEEEPVPGDEECWMPPTTRRRKNPSEFTCEELQDPVTGLTAEQLGPECLDCQGGGPCDPVTITGTDGLTQLPPVAAGTTYPLPETHIFYQDNMGNQSGVLVGLDTVVEEGDGHLYPDTVIPSRPLKNTLGNPVTSFRVTLDDLVNDTVLPAPDAYVEIAGVPVGTVPSGATGNFDCADLVDAVVVEGAGIPEADGLYIPNQSRIENGQPVYEHSADMGAGDDRRFRITSGGWWVLFSNNATPEASFAYSATSEVPAPERPYDVLQANWSEDTAPMLPVPSIRQATVADLCPCAVPEDAWVSLNNQPVGVVPSGGALDVAVINTATNPVGNWDPVNEAFVVPDGDITINGTNNGAVPSGGTIDLFVKDSAGNQIGGNAEDNTWFVGDAQVQLQDSAANPIGAPAPIVAESTGNVITAPDTTIEDQSGAPVASVPAGGTYTVIVVSGIDGGLSNTTYTNSIIQP